jgi:hypothetical protein
MNARQLYLFQLTLLYAAFSLLLLGGHAFLLKRGVDREVLLIANSVIYAMSIITFFLQQKALEDKNPQVFVRSVMATMMIRMLVCAGAVLVYKLFAGDAFSSTTVFISLFLYLIYLAAEAAAIMKLNKNKNG